MVLTKSSILLYAALSSDKVRGNNREGDISSISPVIIGSGGFALETLVYFLLVFFCQAV